MSSVSSPLADAASLRGDPEHAALSVGVQEQWNS